MSRLIGVLALLLTVAGAVPAQSAIVNGDFEAGGAGWTPTAPPRWTVDFRPTGGNPDGYVFLMSPFGDSGGTACVSQTFVCGDPDPGGGCTIELDYQHASINASSLTGRVKIFVDGVLQFTSPPEDFSPWRPLVIEVGCGTHTIDLCLEVDPGNNGWSAGFDNVSAECDSPTSTESARWGTVKSLYR